MSDIAITVKAPGGSPVDITAACVFDQCSFSQQLNAVAGQFSVLVRDPSQVYSFVTGSEILLLVDGSALFGGYVTAIDMGSFAPADSVPADPADYTNRTWTLRGVDYNIIFDKRVWRNTADYLKAIELSAFTTDGAILREAVDHYADLSDFDSSGITDIATIAGGDVLQQGQTIRAEFENLSFFGGAVWYASPAKVFVYVPYDDVVKRWGFSDTPNKTPITVSPDAYQGATYGFREVTGTEDGSFMVNDALVWGGSQFAGASGGTVFSRRQDATSETNHGRWQQAETHFGERLYSIQAQVDARSNVIINGPPGADATGQQKGLKYPQWQFTFTWNSADVPKLSGVPDHIVPGDIVTIELSVFGVTQLLPLRELRISFPDAFEDDGTHLVVFTGTFGLQLSDPFTLWRFLLAAQTKAALANPNNPTIVTDASTSTTYGAQYIGTVTPATDGVTTLFTLPFGFVAGSLSIFMNGLEQRPGVDFVETDNIAGTFTMASPPNSTDNLLAQAITLAS